MSMNATAILIACADVIALAGLLLGPDIQRIRRNRR